MSNYRLVFTVKEINDLSALKKVDGKLAIVDDVADGGVFYYNTDNYGTNDGIDIFNGWTRVNKTAATLTRLGKSIPVTNTEPSTADVLWCDSDNSYQVKISQ